MKIKSYWLWHYSNFLRKWQETSSSAEREYSSFTEAHWWMVCWWDSFLTVKFPAVIRTLLLSHLPSASHILSGCVSDAHSMPFLCSRYHAESSVGAVSASLIPAERWAGESSCTHSLKRVLHERHSGTRINRFTSTLPDDTADEIENKKRRCLCGREEVDRSSAVRNLEMAETK